MPTIFVVGARGIPDVEGGAEKNAERLFPLIVALGWRVVLAGLSDNIKSSSYRGVQLWRAPKLRLLKTDKLLYYVAAVFMAARMRPEIVHLQGLGSAIFLWAYRLLGCKVVVRYGSADYVLSKWGFIGRLGFLAAEYQLRYASAVIAVTPSLAERLRRKGIFRNVHVIANATDDASDFDAGQNVAAEGLYILAVGRVTVQKNFHNLIAGFHRFSERHPEVNLAIAGGVDDKGYMNVVEPLLTPKVQMLGRLPRSHMGALYANAAIYVNSSIHEGSSNAVLEALSWKCPILLSQIPENRDFGLQDLAYFDPEDPVAIEAALERAYADPDDYRVMNGNFLTWNDVAQRTNRIYHDICPQGQRIAEPTADILVPPVIVAGQPSRREGML